MSIYDKMLGDRRPPGPDRIGTLDENGKWHPIDEPSQLEMDRLKLEMSKLDKLSQLEKSGLDKLKLEMDKLDVSGRKDDDGKARYDLLPWRALDEVVGVLTFGAKKYGDHNWRQVENGKRRYLAAALRHLTTYARGQHCDPDSGYSHLAHAACCVMFLMEI